MKTSPDTLSTALASYAVMLNRPQWLDPSKTLLQEQVWRRMIERAEGDGSIRLEDFEQAIDKLLNQDISPHALLPNDVIVTAASIARNRQRQADRMFAEYDTDTLLFEEISRLSISGDTRTFRVDVEAALRSVILSGRPVDEIDKVATAISSISEDALNQRAMLAIKDDDDDDDDDTAMIQRWIDENQP